jgi:glycine/D-amino acid oxidase-like deaminating enzyme
MMGHTAHNNQLVIDEQSWWLKEALAHRPAEQDAAGLRATVTADVAIVGGGFTGLWTAISLRQRCPELKIVLIEAKICGAGASAKNGGLVGGYWGSLPGIAARLGANAALAVAQAGTKAQNALREFARTAHDDLWWREAGNVMVAASPAQDATITQAALDAARLGVPDSAQILTAAAVQDICKTPAFRSGIYYPEGATIHPGRLVRELRAHAIALGVSLYEHTPMVRFKPGTPNLVSTPHGEIVAPEVVLATNVELMRLKEVAPYVTLFSSYAGMSEPAGRDLESTGWTGDQSLTDARMFVHYFRKTPDNRILMGSGSGPIAFGANTVSPQLYRSRHSANRVVQGKNRLLPSLHWLSMAGIWGGPIDVASDRLPYFATIPGTRIHYASGYSGHGVNPTYIGGQCLASLVLGKKDYWTELPFCTRNRPRFPTEPFRFIGGRAIRWGILSTEDADDLGRRRGKTAAALAQLPRLFGLSVGTR